MRDAFRLTTYAVVIVGTLVILIFELITLIKLGLRTYISDLWNYFDTLSLLLTSFVIVNDFLSVPEITDYSLSVIVSFAVFMLWIKVFYWFRLFTGLSFYMRLIRETIYDLRYILVILITILLMFSMVIFAFVQGQPKGK